MLRIKEGIDLKELEKFGFTYTNESEQYYVLEENGIEQNCILIIDRKITIRINDFINYLYTDYDVSVLYDLIRADMVERI